MGIISRMVKYKMLDRSSSTQDYWRSKLGEIAKRKTRSPSLFNDKALKKIKERQTEWEQNILRTYASKNPESKEKFENLSEIEIKRVYTPCDVPYLDYEENIGFPGGHPFTRGVYPTMYRGRTWTMRMFSGYGSAEDTNKRWKYLLEQGETGLSTAFHMPTIYGYDSDSVRAYGEVGKCGVAIDSLKDMETLFEGIPLDQVSTSMTINAPAAVLTAMYAAVGEKQGVPQEKLRGTIQNDLLKEYIAQKSWIFPPEESLRIIRDIMVYCSKQMPLWNYISISGYHIREAGATAVQELAFTLADGFAYVDLGVNAGLNVDEFAPRLSFFFNSHNDFFEEIAKFRAARRIWATVMKDRYHAKDPRSLLLRVHTQTAGCSLTWQQPLVNIVRAAYQALAAVLGGTQSLHTDSYDEAWAVPSEQAALIALRTQQVLAEETGVTNTIDPLAGSYYVEWLTSEMEEQAYKYFDKIDSMGGVLQAIKNGYLQREIADSSYRYQRKVEHDEIPIIGVNKYRINDEEPINYLKVDPVIQEKQIQRVRKLREERDYADWKMSMDQLRKAMQDKSANLMYPILKAVKSYATIGEIIGLGREVFGEWKEPTLF
jgi:methylmalonyl-CoA mutase N-terminal domain/subunit